MDFHNGLSTDIAVLFRGTELSLEETTTLGKQELMYGYIRMSLIYCIYPVKYGLHITIKV